MEATPEGLCAALRGEGRATVFLDGRGGFDEAWGPLLAVDPRLVHVHSASGAPGVDAALGTLDRLVAGRRLRGGPKGCGLVALLAYDLLDAGSTPSRGLPEMFVLAVDASIRFSPGGNPVLAACCENGPDAISAAARVAAIVAGLDEPPRIPTAPATGQPLRTSLPRDAYLRAVGEVREHIRLGDVYQANLTQRFSVPLGSDPFDVYLSLVSATPAPRSAFVEAPGFALASASPEVFLRASPSLAIETWPIKGTRTRSTTPDDDRRAARTLLDSEKDRAELTMIVDLERNDLGRVCRTGSVSVRELGALRSFAAVHHLVAQVVGDLVPGTRPSEILRATFPGGSITGAPKIRAMEILRRLEPVRRGFYTGSLVWFGDDGAIDSSILIRSVMMTRGRAQVGAGGGIVADSDPEAEWRESNDKARALLSVLGAVPEEAT